MTRLIIPTILALLMAGSAFADHHPGDNCGPIEVDGGMDNCARGGEPQDHTWWDPGTYQPGDFIYVPVRFNDTSDDLCEFGWDFAYNPNYLDSVGGFLANTGEFTTSELDALHHLAGGNFVSGNTPPGLTQIGLTIHSFEGDTDECPDCTSRLNVRVWKYASGSVGPMISWGDNSRIFGWVPFRVLAALTEDSGNHRIAQQGSWVTRLDNPPSALCGCPNAGDGRGCDPNTTTLVWEDSIDLGPDGAGTNQVDFRIDGDADGDLCWSADFDRDGSVGISDYGIFQSGFGQSGDYAERRPDADSDGDVGMDDYGKWLSRYQDAEPGCCDPATSPCP